MENRGGEPEEWVPPTAGLCKKCEDQFFVCNCGEIFNKDHGIEVDAYDAPAIDRGEGSYKAPASNLLGKAIEDGKWDDIEWETRSTAGETVLYIVTHHVCHKCLTTPDFAEELEKWSKGMSNPEYTPTEFDKKVLKHLIKAKKGSLPKWKP